MNLKKDITYCLNNLNRITYWKGSHAEKIRQWGDFLKKKKQEGEITEYKMELKVFLEYLRLRREWWKFEDEIKRDFKIDDFEGKIEHIPLSKNFKKFCIELRKDEKKLFKIIKGKEGFELRQEDPKLGLRKLGQKFYCSKDTIQKWISKWQEIKTQIIQWEDDNQLHYEDKLDLEYEKFGRHLAQSKGVKKEDFQKWSVFYDFRYIIDDFVN